jgi:hypothetical protein
VGSSAIISIASLFMAGEDKQILQGVSHAPLHVIATATAQGVSHAPQHDASRLETSRLPQAD